MCKQIRSLYKYVLRAIGFLLTYNLISPYFIFIFHAYKLLQWNFYQLYAEPPSSHINMARPSEVAKFS